MTGGGPALPPRQSIAGAKTSMLASARYCLAFLACCAAGCNSADESPIRADAVVAEAGFVGSAGCATCHESVYERWQASHHALAMQPARTDTVLGDFGGQEVAYFDETARFLRRGDAHVVQALGSDGKMAEFPVAYTFGVEPIQQYLVEFPGGRLQALPWLWDTRPKAAGGQRWLHLYPDEYIAPGDALHWTGRRQNWNYMCAECHSTNVLVGYDTAKDSFATTYAEISVGCEACHGPGATHVAQAEAGNFDSDSGLVINLDDHAGASWLMNPDTGIAGLSEPALARSVQPEACGRCHARRGVLDEPYRYGLMLADTHRLALLGGGLYFPDGQIRDEVYVYGSFIQSRMYQAGVTCSDCHDPHAGSLVTGPDPNLVCAQCHSPAVFAAESHMGHSTETAGCVDCHMPARTYMVVDDRRDHSFRVPQPALSEATGSPHACSNCHAAATAEWAETAIARFGRGRNRPDFATALAAAETGQANAALVEVFDNTEVPGIARATAISSLAPPYTSQDLDALVRGLRDQDPLIRIGALGSLRSFIPEEKARFAAGLLADPVKSVRVEAALTFADSYEYLDVTGRRAFNAAAEEFRRSRLITASQSDSLVSLAAFEASLGNIEQARAAYERALYIEPGWSVIRTNYADFLRQQGEDRTGEVVLRNGIDLDPDAAVLHHALGLLLVRTDRAAEGLESLERAAELDRDNARYAYVVGIAYNSLGRTDEARRVLAEAYAKHERDFDVAWALATVLRDSGDLASAREVLAEMQRRFPGDSRVAALSQLLSEPP